MSNSTIRQLKIDMITDEPNLLLDWFNDIWIKLSIIETDVYHQDGGEIIYYIDGDIKQWVFYQDNKNDIFYCDYDHYWSILETKVDLNYNDIQDVTKLLVDNALNNSVSIPHTQLLAEFDQVDNVLNNSVSIPKVMVVQYQGKVDNAINKYTNE